ncbi:hypothetical protein [Paenibacillus arenosi]|uniref:CARDB domain-containing protein n=1 Tax=Paenibacillus arenosi TaxID=2774142 RepID=A0ABR9AW53_9BACL|nr:hypothetical protein [Paenibacillus arenosi]MBD8498237.1 hypothetical protein [Paenibacillus arenosi]
MISSKKLMISLLSFSMVGALYSPLLLPSNGQVMAAQKNVAVQQPFKPSQLNKVKLSATSYLEVNEVQFYHVEGDKNVYFTVTVHNQGSKSLSLMDYWFSIRSNQGNKYPIQLMGLTEKKDNIVPAKSKKTFKIHAKVDSKLNLSDLKLSVIKWDFSLSNGSFERVIGSVSIPKNYAYITPVGKQREIKQGQNTLVTSASNLELTTVGNHVQASLTVDIKNTSNSAVNLDSLKFYLRTNTNRYYVLDADQSKKSLLPGESARIKFYSKLPTDLKKATYQLFIAEEAGAGTVTGTDAPKASASLPLSYNHLKTIDTRGSVTLKGQSYKLLVENQFVDTKISNVMVDTNSEYHNVTISYAMKNMGKTAIKKPKLQFELLTNVDTSYPVQAGPTDTPEGNTNLLPGVTEEATITASIPASVSLSNMKLTVKRVADENKNNDYLLAQYMVPDTTSVTTESKATYVNKQGTYEVNVDNFERLPWDSKDIINTTITIKNTGKNTQPLPKFAMTAWLSGVKVDSKDIQLLHVDGAIGLKPGESAKIIATSKVSSDSKFENAKIRLSEIVDDKPISTIGNFMIKAADADLPTYDPASTAYYTLTQPGVEAQMNVLETNVYEGKNTNVIRSLLSYRNTGERYSKLPNVVAYYYETSTGVQIPAKLTLSDKEVTPDGVNLISITADIPKKYKASDLKLLVGQGISEGKYITGTTKADSYVNGAFLSLTDDKRESKLLFEVLDLRPFEFKFNKIFARSSNGDQVDFNFEYTLKQNNPFEEMLVDRNLVIEIEYNGNKFSQSYKLGEGNGSLAVGDKISKSFAVDDYAMKGVGSSGFKLNVYDELNGAKKLLMSHRVNNFE